MQTVRSGVIYAVGSFSAHMCPAKVLGCAPIGVVYVLGLLKPKRASVPTQTSNTELIWCNYISEVILLHVAVLRCSLCIYDQ